MSSPSTKDNLDLAENAQHIADRAPAGSLEKAAAGSVAVTCATTRDLAHARTAYDGLAAEPFDFGQPDAAVAPQQRPRAEGVGVEATGEETVAMAGLAQRTADAQAGTVVEREYDERALPRPGAIDLERIRPPVEPVPARQVQVRDVEQPGQAHVSLEAGSVADRHELGRYRRRSHGIGIQPGSRGETSPEPPRARPRQSARQRGHEGQLPRVVQCVPQHRPPRSHRSSRPRAASRS